MNQSCTISRIICGRVTAVTNNNKTNLQTFTSKAMVCRQTTTSSYQNNNTKQLNRNARTRRGSRNSNVTNTINAGSSKKFSSLSLMTYDEQDHFNRNDTYKNNNNFMYFNSPYKLKSNERSVSSKRKRINTGRRRRRDMKQLQQNLRGIFPENHDENLPPPVPEPKFSVQKRVLPTSLLALSSPVGRKYLIQALQENTAESYWSLIEQFVNQSDPAFCGVTTLMMVLNAMQFDPNVRWRGGWRYFGSEDVLLNRCCIDAERIRRQGITMEQFACLARCQGMRVTLKRPPSLPRPESLLPSISEASNSIDAFRNDIIETLTTNLDKNGSDDGISGMLVVSYSREVLGQTGDGHFSPIAAFHEPTDQVLILDVARFKYSPYWVKIEDLYESMKPLDSISQKPRGWYVCHPPHLSTQQQKLKQKLLSKQDHEEQEELPISDTNVIMEGQRPAHLVPHVNERRDICPVGKIKVHYCRGFSSSAGQEQ